MHMPEAKEQQIIAQYDDGFESLDGSGSCDSNKEEPDMSLTAEEYDTAMKSSALHNEPIENSLVIHKSCPKYSKQSDTHVISYCCEHCGSNNQYLTTSQHIPSECSMLITANVNCMNSKNCSLENKRIMKAEDDKSTNLNQSSTFILC